MNVDIGYRETKLRQSSETVKSEQTNFEDPLSPDHNLKTCFFFYCHSADILPCF